MPTGKKGEYDCSRVLTRKKGEPAAAPMTPDEAPERMLIGRLWYCFTSASEAWEKDRLRRREFMWVRMGS